MPITFLAHQAPVLPLKRRWPALDGVAMVVGSTVPDLARATQRATPRLFLGQPLWWDGHTLTQQLGWSLPVGLVLTWVVRRLLAPRLGPYLPDLGDFHLRDVRLVARTRHRWWVIAGSVLIGSVSHIVLDLFTHSDRPNSPVLPGLDVVVGTVGGHSVTTANVVQVLASLCLSAFTVWEMWRIGRERLICRWSGVAPVPVDPPPARNAVRFAAVVVLVLTAVWAATQWGRGFSVALMTWVWLATVGLSLLALVVGRVPEPEPVEVAGS
jgi:Domain of unknown function (DUF4184)